MARSIRIQQRQAALKSAAIGAGTGYVQNGTEITARRTAHLSGNLHSDKVCGWSAYDTFQFPRNGEGALFPGKLRRQEIRQQVDDATGRQGHAADPGKNISHNYTWYAACLCLVTQTAAA